MKEFKLYVVGGYVRDKLLGVESKDVDFAFEFTREYLDLIGGATPNALYLIMNDLLKDRGFDIFLETPECFTTRARFPEDHEHAGLTADFVMCRKETYPDPETRTPKVEVGNIYDDLKRRDFTVNAIAITEDGEYLDPFNGQKDLQDRILKCPVDAQTSFNDDPLRAIRCLRFLLTKGFVPSDDCIKALEDGKMWAKFDKVVSRERVREELLRMFKFDTLQTLSILNAFVNPVFIQDIIFKNDLWLKPTFEKR